MKLSTTEHQLLMLQMIVNEARKGSDTVRVSKTALWNLLVDHYQMNGELGRRGKAPQLPHQVAS